MADVSLNELKTKTDSLPNDWLVSLINPKGGEPAEIMTVAKFIELLFEKVPKAVKYNNIASIDFTTEAGYGYSTAGWLYTGPILKFGTSDGYNVHIQGEPNNNRLSMRGVYNESYKPWKTFAFLEDISNIISSPTANSLTEASPVLESRQVRSTCLQNHLYQILLPTCLGKREKMVQLQLKRNHQENSMSGQLTRSEKLSWNYRKKTRDLNKSSISLTIARYNKCNLPRAGPPRLIN